MNLTLKNVAEFERPAGSADDDPQVGEDELGNPLFLNRMSGQKYKVSLSHDQRTTKTKVADTLSNLRMPTLKEIGTVALDAAKGLWDVVDTPRAIAAGEKQPTLGDAYAVGGMAAVGTLPFSAPQGATRIFGGRTAATADLSRLAEFTKRIEGHEKPEELWKELGWLKDESGVMRFEIDDSKATYRSPDPDKDRNKYFELQEVLNHDELFKAYPELKNIKIVEATWLEDDVFGELKFNSVNEPYIVVRVDLSKEEKLKATLHELNHVVQSIEYPNFEAKYWEYDDRFGYMKNPFEKESREVEARSGLSSEERRSKFPRLKEVGELDAEN